MEWKDIIKARAKSQGYSMTTTQGKYSDIYTLKKGTFEREFIILIDIEKFLNNKKHKE